MRNTGLEEVQAGIKIASWNINNLRYADDSPLMGQSEEELKRLLMKVKEESEKVGLKISIQKTKLMISGPITWWQIDGQTMQIVTDYFGGESKITADGDWCHEIKRCLLLGRKIMTKQHIKKQRHYFDNKCPTSQSWTLTRQRFSSSHVWMWDLDNKESWVPKDWCF